MNPDFGILVLAAGKASRFGSDKLLAAMPDGQPVISHSLLPLQAMAKRYQLKLCVVTRADNHALINYLIEKDNSIQNLILGILQQNNIKCCLDR